MSLAIISRRSSAKRRVERHKRLVEQQQVRLDGERPRKRDAPGEPQRKFAREMRRMFGEPEFVEKRGDVVFARMRRGDADIVDDAAPGQQSRLLENHAEPAVFGQDDRSDVVLVESGDESQQSRLAAAGRADDRARLSRGQRQPQIFQRAKRAAAGGMIILRRDRDVERRRAASARRVVQEAAPEKFRRRASARRREARKQAEASCQRAERPC